MNDLPDQQRQTRRGVLHSLLFFAVLVAFAVALFLYSPPIPQKQHYHSFADQRTLFGVPHFLNVASNLPFLAIGALGLWFVLRRIRFQSPSERWPYALFFLGVGLTAFGSSYYHLEPNNDRLLWDRLPMAVAFMALFCGILADRVSLKLGLCLLPVLVAAGLGSVLYWHWTETQGRGDLRAYYLVQFYPMLILPFLLLLFPSRYTGAAYLLGALGWYIVAKIVEDPCDLPIYALGNVVSGHTLKHLAAALAAYWLFEMLRRRRSLLSQHPAW